MLEFADGFVNRTAFVKCQSRNTRLLVMPTSDANRPVAGTAAALLEVLGPEVPTNTPAQNRWQLLGVVFDFAGPFFGLRLINRGPALNVIFHHGKEVSSVSAGIEHGSLDW